MSSTDNEITSPDEADELNIRIKFGARPNQHMPASWAASVLTLLAERQPSLFGSLMTEAAIGYRATSRGRKSTSGHQADEPDEPDEPVIRLSA